jgi:FkbM family methyltransferase
MPFSTWKHWKYHGRAVLTRLGLWETVERWRLHHRFRTGFLHEPDFNFFRRFQGSRELFVDVGANLGQSALSFRVANQTCPILSFEPNEQMGASLREVKRLLGRHFDFRLHGLGARTEVKWLFVPLVKGIPFFQCASFHREFLEDNPDRKRMFYELTGIDRFTLAKRAIQLVRFDELGLNPAFIKMDVEGGEIDVVTGMEETLARCRPLVMTEGTIVQDFLSRRGYRMFVHQPASNCLRAVGNCENALNFFFVPQEKVPILEDSGAIAA